MHTVKISRSGQGIAVPLDIEVSVIIRHAYASGYGNWNGNWHGNWYGNSNFIMSEGIKTEAVRYGLT